MLKTKYIKQGFFRMGKLKNNQKGFTAVEILLTLIFLAIIGAIGVYVAHNHKTNKSVVTTNSSTPSSTKSTTTTPNVYAGWKQYCSSNEKACFKYPSTWTFNNRCTPSTDCTGGDNVGVASPNNSQVGFTSYITGRGGDCSGAPDSYITSVTHLPRVKGLYIVQLTRADLGDINLGIDDTIHGSVPKTGDTGSCFLYTQFTAKNTPNAGASLNVHVPASAKSSDLNDALLLLKSFYYQ
jgi:hypothetical protein